MRTSNLVFAASLVAFSSSALAESPQSNYPDQSGPNQSFPVGFRDYMSVGTLDRTTYQPQLAGGLSNIIWVNRCLGDCEFTIVSDFADDAQNNETSITDPFEPLPVGTRVTVPEFQYSQDVYDATIECLREVWRPYNVEIVTEEPAPGVLHHEAVLAGTATDIGYREEVGGGRILGVAPSICEVRNNVISFSFANAAGDNPTTLCWVVAHESGHSFGLEHQVACEDTMTYDTSCGDRKFFRDAQVACGTTPETQLPQCACGGQTQNTHDWLVRVFGEGDGAEPPSLRILAPQPDAVVDDGYPILVDASDARTVFRPNPDSNIRALDRVEFYINGSLVRTVETPNGSGDSGYLYITPDSQSSGVQNIEVRAYNDLGLVTAQTVTAIKGTACSANADCAIDEECDSGACTVLPPFIDNGDECVTDNQCLSGQCTNSSEGARCTTDCVPGVEDTCSEGFECLATSGAQGVCWPASSDSGGCAVSNPATSGAPWLLALALLALPRRRRR